MGGVCQRSRDRHTDTLRLCGAMQKSARPVYHREDTCVSVCVVVNGGGYECPWELGVCV